MVVHNSTKNKHHHTVIDYVLESNRIVPKCFSSLVQELFQFFKSFSIFVTVFNYELFII